MSKNQTSDHESALVMNAYVDGISGHKSLFEQIGVRKVDFVDGVTPDLEEKMFSGKGEFEVKYASSKKGPIKVSKFNTLKDAQKFLAQVKGEGMNGIISKGGKPVKEALDSDDKPTVKKVVKMLKKASQAHAGQADDLEKSMKEDNVDEADKVINQIKRRLTRFLKIS